MAKYKLILRADDAGSSHAANQGILKVVNAGLVKNVSLMAIGSKITEAATLLKDRNDLCFGVHLVINSEWDKVKWGPLTVLTKESGLVDDEGYFVNETAKFKKVKPKISDIIAEYDAQYNYLRNLGFKISYADSHMMPELQIDGLQEAVDQWTKEKGILNHADYYSFPPNIQKLVAKELSLLSFFHQIPQGQYFYVIHPAKESEEMRQTGNSHHSGESVAHERNKEMKRFSGRWAKSLMKLLSIETIRYDQADLVPRLDLKGMLEESRGE